MSGNHTSRSSPEKAAGNRTYEVDSRWRAAPRPPVTARSSSAYSGSSTRSCRSAAPTNQRTTPSQSPASSRTPA
ncbi:hypothetical protein C4J65_15575 [Streptomyces sp. CB09001]|nr:hypothetical protein C4J65_15575 [Streptomyces sp. CB09001]